MTTPTRNVIVRLFGPGGVPAPNGTKVTATLDKTDLYQGFIVPREVSALTVDGIATLACFPNHPSTGLGTTGSVYTFRASPKGFLQGFVVEDVQVPNNDTSLDAIVNLGAAPALSAAQATLASAAAASGSAGASATAAAASAAAADASKVAAQNAASAAQSSANAASASESSAISAATAAAASAAAAAGSGSAAASATAAAASASAAAGSATQASNSAASAQDWAIKATPVSGSNESAKTYAGWAADERFQAGIYAGQASTDAGTASTKATQAAQSATTAAGSATAAAGSATAAGTSATNAAGSATAAAGSASAANTSAGNAASSASTASTAAGNASTSATTATTKAGEAAASATTAGTAATNAGNSATAAAGSASAAASSATAAAGSATTATNQASTATTAATLAQNWAEKTDAPVDGSGARSAKYWAQQAALGSIGSMTADVSLYVSTTGDDDNDGLTNSTPKLSLVNAAYTAERFASGRYAVAINIGDGTYDESVVFEKPGKYILVGNASNKRAVHINPTTAPDGPLGASTPGVVVMVTNVKLSNSATGTGRGTCAFAENGGALIVGAGVVFGTINAESMPNQAHVGAFEGGRVFMSDDYEIDGNASKHLYAAGAGSFIQGGYQTATTNGARTFSGAFAVAEELGQILHGGTTWALAGGASVAGAKFLARNGGYFDGFGDATIDYFPGSTAGTFSGPGNYYAPIRVDGPGLFVTLPTASAALFGARATVSDSSTTTAGATITGGGVNKVFARCNGTNWVVE